MGVNKVILIGNLGRDPELRHTAKGNAVAQLNVATTRRWTNKQNETVEETEWHRVSVWGNQAESCGKYLKKGRQVYIEGRLQTSSYEQDGIKKYSTEIIAQTVQFLGGKSDGDSGRASSENSGGGMMGSSSPAPNTVPDPSSGGDDDIPF